MSKLSITAPILCLLLAGAPAAANTVSDAVGDFLPTYTGPQLADLDVKSFSVNYDSVASLFTISATMAGAITPGTDGFYIIGVNTGTGTIRPFAPLGQGNVIFNQAIQINKNGTGNIGAVTIDPSAISISGDTFSVNLLASLMPSTGFTPENYGFNLWPRTGNGNALISDFAPENATLAAVPEVASWAMMLAGFAALGGCLRTSRRPRIAFA